MGRHSLAVVRSRAQRKEGEQPAGRRGERKLLAVTFRGHSPQQPHLQHGLTLYLHPRLRLYPAFDAALTEPKTASAQADG